MGRVLKPLLTVGLVAASIATGGLASVAGVLGVSTSAVTLAAVTFAASTVMGALSKRGNSLSGFDPKSVNIDPAAPRKLAFGLTPLAMDVRYVEPSGTNQEFVDYIVALAAHKCHEIDSIYIEEDLAWTPSGGAVGKFAGYLTVEVILDAGAAAHHTVNGGAIWGSTRRLTGCTTMKVRVKRSDNSKKSQSPFGSGIGGRWTVVGRGMPVYDPARDSTVAGGSGSQRATDQTTWAYTVSGVERGNNPALQLLAFLLGWRIGGEVSVGVGLPADVIDLPNFATAAALCDESVALNGGGTQRRYEAGRTFSDADDPMAVVTELLKAMNGELTDDGGRLALRIAINDLTPVVTLTDDDFVGGFSWQPQPSIDQQYTVVRGRYVQPGPPSLFGFADFSEVAIPRTSNAPRPLVLELTAVQDQRRAERIAKQAAQRSLYQGTFTVKLGIRGWLLRRNMVAAITSNARGWTAKLFRVRSLNFNDDATVEAVFREENAAINAWDRNESPVVTPVAPVVFDSRAAASWLMADIDAGATLNEDAGNQIGAAASFAQATFLNGANLQVIGGRPLAALASGANATVIYSDFQPVRGGQRLYFEITAYSDVTSPDFILYGYNWQDAAGTVYAVDLPLMAFNGSEAVGASNAKTKRETVVIPAAAVSARLYGIRLNWSGTGTFLTSRPYQGHAQRGSDVTGEALPALPQGAWVAGRDYEAGAIVNESNGQWMARRAHTSTSANKPGLDDTWVLSGASPDTANLGTSASVSFSTGSMASTSYGTAAASFTVKAGSGGVVDLAVAAEVALEAGSSASAAVKVQRWTGSVWADVGSEAVSATVTDTSSDTRFAVFNVARQATGLTNGTAYDFRILGRRVGGAGGAEASVSGQLTGVGR